MGGEGNLKSLYVLDDLISIILKIKKYRYESYDWFLKATDGKKWLCDSKRISFVMMEQLCISIVVVVT